MTATIRPDRPSRPSSAAASAAAGGDDPTGAERRAVEDRLRARYPDIDPVLIRATVTECFRAFDDAPVRNFVPLLAENRAYRALRARQITD
jgi:hypothetical protein